MTEISIYKMASGCGITDYIFCETTRDVCDIFFSALGILLIIGLIYIKTRYTSKNPDDSYAQ